jgi:hypothetical protein
MTKEEKNKQLIGNILVEHSILMTPLQATFYDQHKRQPKYGDDIFKSFYEYLDNRLNATRKTTDKIYKLKSGEDIHLQRLLEKISKIRNIAAHQTWDLVNGLSDLPDEARGRLLGNYHGTAEQLYEEWTFYGQQFDKIFEIWNSVNLDTFDIDGTQIGDY